MAQSSWIGKTLGNRYLIEELLGQGGMSAVFKAEDPNLRRVVAVKLIHSHLSDDPQFVSRFEEEAAAVAQLRHPNIIQVFDFENDSDTYYMVMEFVPGETLQDRLKRVNSAERRMEAKEAIKITAEICDALEYAHKRGMIHRDIKPANIMLNVQSQAILMDFGIAKIVGGKRHTATGAVVGTAIYMAPEQIKGEQIDGRVDIYALGVTLFEMLSGRPPFEADSAMTTLMMHVNDPVPDLAAINPDVPQALIQVIGKALTKDRNNRFRSAAEFAAALRAIDPDKTGAFAADSTEPLAMAGGATMVEPAAVPGVSGMLDGATMVEQPATPPPPGGATTIEPQPTPGIAAPPPPAQAPPAAAKSGLPMGRIAMFGGGGLAVLLLLIFVGSQFLGGGGGTTPTPEATATLESIAATEAAIAIAPPTETPIPPTATITPLPSETSLPTATPTETVPPGPYVRINEITIENDRYVVVYETFEYTEELPGTHVHFYYDTVSEANAGSPGSGPWILYGGPRPFQEYTVGSRPTQATQMCARVANPNHSIIPGSGNCMDLPS
jgi:serine/threonine-protein kinase